MKTIFYFLEMLLDLDNCLLKTQIVFITISLCTRERWENIVLSEFSSLSSGSEEQEKKIKKKKQTKKKLHLAIIYSPPSFYFVQVNGCLVEAYNPHKYCQR